MSFARPYLLLLLALIPAVWLLAEIHRGRLRGGVGFSHPPGLVLPRSGRATARRLLPLLRALALALLVVALAGPRSGRTKVRSFSEGIDIVLAVDISSSMKALDFAPGNRLDAAKEVAREFIERRAGDRIGLVIFASNSYTQCPLTRDREMVQRLLAEVEIGDIEDGTAIGMALGNALNRLRDVPGESRVAILLTDGMNNAGVLDPLTAASLARQMGVRVYTVGAGTRGEVPVPIDHPIFGRSVRQVRVDLDEEMLQAIADSTGGLYFQAKDRASLEQVFATIDRLERTRVEVEEYVEYRDVGAALLWPALILLLVEMISAASWLRRLP